MRIKSGVNLNGVRWQLWYAAAIYDAVRTFNGLGEGTITSGTDPGDMFGAERVAGTLHPSGNAIDLRTTDLPPGYDHAVAQAMLHYLPPPWRVVVEQDHLHVEWREGTEVARG